MFTRDEEIALRNYTQQIIMNPRPMEAQKFSLNGKYLWCEDWEIIEILKYLFNGHEGYMGDPPPNRLKNNPLFSKDAIAKIASDLSAQCGHDVHKIILALKMRRTKNDA